MQARLDDVIELDPIDWGYDHFTVNNLTYHGTSVTVVWQKPGAPTYYPLAPAGYSLYVGGRRVATVDDLAHITWDSKTGKVTVLDGSATHVNYSAADALATATEVGLHDNDRVVDAFQKAGLDLKPESSGLVNLALGKPATASFTTTTPAVAGDLAGQRGRRLHDQRHPGHLRRLRGHEPDLGRQRLAERPGLAADRLRGAQALRPGQAVLLLQQGMGRERQHLQGAERVLDPVLRRQRLGRRPRARPSRRRRRRPTTTASTSRP